MKMNLLQDALRAAELRVWFQSYSCHFHAVFVLYKNSRKKDSERCTSHNKYHA